MLSFDPQRAYLDQANPCLIEASKPTIVTPLPQCRYQATAEALTTLPTALATALPHLSHLHISGITTLPPGFISALSTLSTLTSLGLLCLNGLEAPAELSLLTQLSQLDLQCFGGDLSMYHLVPLKDTLQVLGLVGMDGASMMM